MATDWIWTGGENKGKERRIDGGEDLVNSIVIVMYVCIRLINLDGTNAWHLSQST